VSKKCYKIHTGLGKHSEAESRWGWWNICLLVAAEYYSPFRKEGRKFSMNATNKFRNKKTIEIKTILSRETGVDI